MLRAVAPACSVVVCSTCRVSADQREDEAGRRGGALLADALRAEQDSDPAYADLVVEEMPCMFACQHHCTVHIRAPGRFGYVLGGFAPDAPTARAILDYAALHARSEYGAVPYQQWPEEVKGHFLLRIPPEGFLGS